jgi:hypothetical protein
MDKVGFYCVNFNDDARKSRMEARFLTQGLFLTFVDPIHADDPRLNGLPATEMRNGAIMLQHIESLRHFLEETDYEYCVVCEDDVHLHRNFRVLLEYVLQEGIPKYDVLLLGYLWHEPLYTSSFVPATPLTFWRYHSELWGAQMYIVSRSHASYLVNKYSKPILTDPVPYNPDWTITKEGNCALCVPMLAVEEGEVKTDHWGQKTYHRKCHLANMTADYS